MVTKGSRGDRVFRLVNGTLLALLAFTTLYPFLNTLAVSLSDGAQIVSGRVFLLPRGFNTSAYKVVFANPVYFISFRNTVLVTAAGTAISMLLSILGAYPLSKRRLKGRKFLMLLVVFTMFFSGGLIPRYLLVRDLGMLNTLWALFIPVAISAWNMIILRNFFQAIPDSLEESAEIDGASFPTILVRVILPLSKPALATISLFYAVKYWNSFFDAVIYITDTRKTVLQAYLSQLILDEVAAGSSIELLEEQLELMEIVPDSVRAATVLCTVVPILVVYPWIQKYFVKGVLIGSLKG